MDHQAPNDDEILNEFVRVVRTAGATVVEARVIEWSSPSQPSSHWIAAVQLDARASEDEATRACRQVLDDPNFFEVCERCEQRNPVGWMGPSARCHACMRRYDGVVF